MTFMLSQSFHNTNLRRKSFSGKELKQQDFKQAQLRNVNFSNADLEAANFSQADLREAKFDNGNLKKANFNSAKTGLQIQWKAIYLLTSFFLVFLAGIQSGILANMIGGTVADAIRQSRDGSGFEDNLYTLVLLLSLFVPSIIIVFRGIKLFITTVFINIILIVALACFKEILHRGEEANIIILTIFIPLLIAMFLVIIGIEALSFNLIKVLSERKSQNQIIFVAIFVTLLTTILVIINQTIIIDDSSKIQNLATFCIAIYQGLIICFMGCKSIEKNKEWSWAYTFAIAIVATKGTSFYQADLTEANLTEINLGNTNFIKANLTRTCWLNAKNLDKARVEGTYLENEQIRQLVVTGNGRDQNFDNLDLRGCNLQYADLTDASFIGTKLSEATLEGANLTRAKLVKAQLYGTNLTNAILTGACIQDWAISLDTQFEGIKCDYVYMRLETKEDPDPWRKPDNRNEIFKEGDFSSFIAPIIKTQQLYQTQNVDLREVAENYSILDIFHHEGVDPSAAAIAFQRLIEKYPESGLQVLSIEGRGNDKIHFQAQVTDDVNRSLLSQEYNEIYHQIKSGSYQDLLALLAGVSEKDKYIVELRNLLETALKQNRFYVETYQETRNIKIRKGDYRETSINEGNYRETSVNDRGSYVEGNSIQDFPQPES